MHWMIIEVQGLQRISDSRLRNTFKSVLMRISRFAKEHFMQRIGVFQSREGDLPVRHEILCSVQANKTKQ